MHGFLHAPSPQQDLKSDQIGGILDELRRVVEDRDAADALSTALRIRHETSVSLTWSERQRLLDAIAAAADAATTSLPESLGRGHVQRGMVCFAALIRFWGANPAERATHDPDQLEDCRDCVAILAAELEILHRTEQMLLRAGKVQQS